LTRLIGKKGSVGLLKKNSSRSIPCANNPGNFQLKDIHPVKLNNFQPTTRGF
jgi:hypothetical protein